MYEAQNSCGIKITWKSQRIYSRVVSSRLIIIYCWKWTHYLPIVIFLAINISVPRKARNFPIQSIPTLATLQTSRMPPSINSLQVKSVRNFKSTTGTNRATAILIWMMRRWCRWSSRGLKRFYFGYVMLKGRMWSAHFRRRPAYVRTMLLVTTEVRLMRSTYVRSAGRLVIVIWWCAAGATAWDAWFDVAHGRIAGWKVRR